VRHLFMFLILVKDCVFNYKFDIESIFFDTRQLERFFFLGLSD